MDHFPLSFTLSSLLSLSETIFSPPLWCTYSFSHFVFFFLIFIFFPFLLCFFFLLSPFSSFLLCLVFFALSSDFCDHATTSTTLLNHLRPSCYTWPDRFRQFYIHVRVRLIYYNVWRSPLSFLLFFILPSPATRSRELRILSGEHDYSKSTILGNFSKMWYQFM